MISHQIQRGLSRVSMKRTKDTKDVTKEGFQAKCENFWLIRENQSNEQLPSIQNYESESSFKYSLYCRLYSIAH